MIFLVKLSGFTRRVMFEWISAWLCTCLQITLGVIITSARRICFHLCLFVCLCVCVCVCLFVYLFVCFFMSVCLFVCLFICLYVRLFVCLFVCLHVCLYFTNKSIAPIFMKVCRRIYHTPMTNPLNFGGIWLKIDW